MASIRGIVGRLRGDRLDTVAADVAELRARLLEVNNAAQHNGHAVAELGHSLVAVHEALARIVALLDEQRTVLLELNHDVRSGAEETLPLFLGYAERLRLDTDTAIGAVQVIERQLARLDGADPGSATAEPA